MRRLDGFLSVFKPRGMTSFDVIRFCQRVFPKVKIGHAGTLDPDAAGLLILAFGSATRLLQYLNTDPKVYRFLIQFGEETDTLDATGAVIHSGGCIPGERELFEIVQKFTGPQMQKPPAYSAIKHNGKRAYALARNGKPPVLAARPITVYTLSLLHYDSVIGAAECEVSCSGGTYVRSLARDIAAGLGTYGYTKEIHRTACGKFSEKDAVHANEITLKTPFISIPEGLSHIPSYEIDEECEKNIRFGRDITAPDLLQTEGSQALAVFREQFIALLSKNTDNTFHPSVVSAPGNNGSA